MSILQELLTILDESKMAEKHQDLQDAICDEFNLEDTDKMVGKIMAYLTDNEEDDAVDDFLFSHFEKDMPYGTAKARSGDPKNWIADHMSQIFKDKY
jgi:hypothetical protein